MSNGVLYLCDVHADVTFKKAPVPRRGILQLAPGQAEDGYGEQISTDYMARVKGRWKRVYCICYSNAGSLYVKDGGICLFVRDMDIPDEVRR